MTESVFIYLNLDFRLFGEQGRVSLGAFFRFDYVKLRLAI